MNRNDILKWVKEAYGTEPEYLWLDSPNYAVLRHENNKKWYAVILDVPREKLGLAGEGKADILNLKCDPILSGSLRLREEFIPPYHMNKTAWLGVLLERVTDVSEIRDLIQFSFELTGKKKKK